MNCAAAVTRLHRRAAETAGARGRVPATEPRGSRHATHGFRRDRHRARQDARLTEPAPTGILHLAGRLGSNAATRRITPGESEAKMGPVRLIVNPKAGGGHGGRMAQAVAEALREAGGEPETQFTEAQGHGIELARLAVQAGCRELVAAGGDGTFHEVVNGLLLAGGKGTVVSFIPLGRGGDLTRMLGIRDRRQACHRAVEGEERWVDAGRLECRAGGGMLSRYFIGQAGMGFDAEVSDRVNHSRRRVPSDSVTYYLALLTGLIRYHNKRVTLALDDYSPPRELRVNAVVVANGQYFGGGMRIAPDADMADASFDVVTLGDFGKIEVMVNSPRLYSGSHVRHRRFSVARARHVVVESSDRVLVQADGEVIGETPCELTPLPHAVRVRALDGRPRLTHWHSTNERPTPDAMNPGNGAAACQLVGISKRLARFRRSTMCI